MKIQCSCGAKYVFDIAPGMQPVQFVCKNCGQDYSAFVNELIRRELGEPAAPQSPPSPAASAAPAAPSTPEAPRLRISRAHAPEAAPQEQVPVSKYCPTHRTELATEHCQVCKKPICPKCIDTFGPFCSAFCRNKLEAPRMNAPVYIGRKFAAQRQFWRKTGLISGVLGTVAFCAFAFWIWYAWIGSVPHSCFSVRWDAISHSGSSWLVGDDQVVFLHGGTLARYNVKTKQKVWSLDLVTSQKVDDALKREDEERAEEQRQSGESREPLMIPSQREKYARIGLEQELSLEGSGKNVWIAQGNTLTHYDWDTGNVLQQVTLTNDIEGQLIGQGDEFMGVGHAEKGAQVVTHINMEDGQVRSDQFAAPAAPALAQNAGPVRSAPAQGGLPLSPNGEDRPLNPQRVSQQVQNMSYPARLALPALLANSEHNRQISREIRDEDQSSQPRQNARTVAPQQQFANFQNFSLVPDGNTYLAFASQMTQENLVTREAMKAPPQHSALDSPDLSSANETAAVNEQLNEIQRNNGGDKVVEDQSRYQVAIRRLDSPQPDWTGEVVGPPQFFPFKTVNVIAAGKTIIALDKTDKLLWQSQLTYDVTGSDSQSGERPQESQFGQGPCAENNGILFVFDQAVLTAFDAASGNVRWRIPSVGIVGLFFDDKGMLYVNTTTGNPDDIRYSRQIDVTKQTEAVVQKVDPSTGAILWTSKPGGYISYLSGKFIYAFQYYDPGDQEDETSDALDGLQKPAYFRIMRVNPANGHLMWFYNEGRAPVDIHFDHNIISIVLKKEVEVLRFFTF